MLKPISQMSPRPTDALEFFSDDTARWCQGAGVRNVHGESCSYSDHDATSMCLGAALGKFYPNESEMSVALGRARGVIEEKWGHIGMIPSWNDASERTIDDILYVCREARL